MKLWCHPNAVAKVKKELAHILGLQQQDTSFRVVPDHRSNVSHINLACHIAQLHTIDCRQASVRIQEFWLIEFRIESAELRFMVDSAVLLQIATTRPPRS